VSQVPDVKENFFRQWTKESAWVYGWLITDGYVRPGAVSLDLHKKDEDVLRKVATLLGYDGQIKERRGNIRYLAIYRNALVSDLIEKGFVIHDKSRNIRIPDIPDDLKPHLLRGIFEGDGSIRSNYNGSLEVNVTSCSPGLVEDLVELLNENGIETSLLHDRRSGAVKVQSKNMASALKWAFFMYRDSEPYMRMDRKYNAYIDFLKSYFERPRRSKTNNLLVSEAMRYFAA